MANAVDILQRLNTGVLVVDGQERIIFCNQWFVKGMGCHEEVITDHKLTELFPRFKEGRLHQAFTDAIEFGISSVLSHSLHGNIFPLSSKYGDPIDHAIWIQAMQSEDRWDALIQISDVSSSTRRERSLRKAYRAAEEAGKAKEEFLAAMSHELRTPLTTIIGNSEMLAEQESDHDRLEMIDTIEAAGRRQLALVNDILDMSKIQSGKFTIHEAPYNLSVLLKELKHMLAINARDAGLDLVVEQKSDEPYLLQGDGQRIGQILINLIGNAIKFTEEGSVKLVVWHERKHLFFQVRDTGIGMTPETIDRLFGRFEQADGSISRRFGGSGLGLFISENLALLMGGSIDVSSQQGVGSIFQLILPYKPTRVAASQDREGKEGRVLHEVLNGHVLIAEDTPELQLLERRMLEGLGLEVTTANNGEEAYELTIHSGPFDLILMDMQMPILDGIGATKLIRERGIKTPVIALTANVMQKHRDAFVEAGCDGFLGKPFEKYEMIQVLKKHLPQKPAAPSSALDEVNDEIMGLFIESITRHKEGLTAAFKAKDWDQVYDIAHVLKGSGRPFGYSEMSNIGAATCKAVERQDYELVTRLVERLMGEMNKVVP